jgi:hypothetical protein
MASLDLGTAPFELQDLDVFDADQGGAPLGMFVH